MKKDTLTSIKKYIRMFEHEQDSVQNALIAKMIVKALCGGLIPHIGVVTYLLVYIATIIQE